MIIDAVFQFARGRAGLMTACFGLALSGELVGSDWPPASIQNRLPRISPDYQGIVIPANIAPLNFLVQETGVQYRVKIHSRHGSPVEILTGQPAVDIPLRPWQELLKANPGESLFCEVAIKTTTDAWLQFNTITNTIAREEIDGYLVYRLLNWQFSLYTAGTIGIYQRNLHNFDESTVLCVQNRQTKDPCCVNCHSFINNRPETMALHIRDGRMGKPMLLARACEATTINQPASLLAWHPSGRLLTTAVNKFGQIFHSLGRNVDGFDEAGDLNAYFIGENRFQKIPQTATPDYWETWPGWSPDGKYLYFCRTPVSSLDHYREIQYDLMRIPYDLTNNVWGEVESILTAKETGLSIAQPRLSPDGKYLLFCMFPYSGFPASQPGSDLYLMDTATQQYRRLDEVNSNQAESWHSWSSNNRWFVFSSKRKDGYLTRPYFSHLDEQGKASKPFLLPQKDPAFYDSMHKLNNLPELITGPVQVSQRALYEAIYRPKKLIKPHGAGQPATPRPPEKVSAPPGSAEPHSESRREE